jgi:hypothetical protein
MAHKDSSRGFVVDHTVGISCGLESSRDCEGLRVESHNLVLLSICKEPCVQLLHDKDSVDETKTVKRPQSLL